MRGSLFLLFTVAASLQVSGALAAPVREIVVANEALVAGGKHVPNNLEAFLRRVEQVTGWPAGSLKGKAFARPREALDYMRKNKTAFAILPVHQFVEGRRELKLYPLGRAVGLEGPKTGFWGVARSGKQPFDRLEGASGIKLAITEAHDPQWLKVLFEGNVKNPTQQFTFVEVPTGEEAISAVLSKKADVAMVYEREFNTVRDRVQSANSDLAWIYASDALPPPVIVSVGKNASKADKKKFTEALGKLCKGEGADACARMAIMYIEPGRAESYIEVIKKYESY